jgi:hypothetical protein
METECRKGGLYLNVKKTQVMAENTENVKVTTVNGSILEVMILNILVYGWLLLTKTLSPGKL